YILVLEDLGALTVGNQVAGLSPAQARAAVRTIGRFHAHWWQSAKLESLAWMPASNLDMAAAYRQHWPVFVRKLGPLLTPAEVALGEEAGLHFDRLQAALTDWPHTIVHWDFRGDNLIFDDLGAPDPVVIIDWQCAVRGKGVFDVARIVCG